MEQKVPKISDADITRLIGRDFPNESVGSIFDILSNYQSESKDGRNRVYAALIKISEGDVDLLKENVSKAEADFRDVIALSEYPNYRPFAFDESVEESKLNELMEDDWKQYQEWLNK